jgi:NitT/TauT family transport system substrate-binding protein
MVDTLRWVRAHSAADVRARLPQPFRTENESVDLETLGDSIAVSSPDGLMPPGAAEAVCRVISVSMETLRTAKIDVGATYTNEFVKGDR